jgi:dihydroxy-acid dehydratase
MIELDVQERKIHLRVSDTELVKRRETWKPPAKRFERGYGAIFANECTQANEGCDFRFLHDAGAPLPEPDIY